MKKPKSILKIIKPWHIITFLTTIVLFFVIRLVNLNGLPVFVDEAIYVRWSQVMRSEPSLRFISLQDGKQPLFMWMLMPLLKLINDPLIAGRLLSVFAGLGSLLGLTILSFLLFSSIPISLITAFLYSVIPYAVFFDRMALVDSLLAMFAVWSLLLGYLYVKTPRLDLSLILGAVIGFGLLSKSPAVFFYFWQPLLAIFFYRKGWFRISPRTVAEAKRRTFPRWNSSFFKLLAGWLLAFIISQGIYNILRLGPNFQMVGSRNQDYLFSFSQILTHPLNPLLGNLKSTFSWIINLFTWPLAIIIPLGLFTFQRRRRNWSLFLISAFPLFTQALVAKVYTPRYLLFAVLPLIILSAFSLTQLIQKQKKISLLLIIVILLFPLISSTRYILSPNKVNMPQRMRNGYLEEWTAGWGQRDLANFLINLRNKGKTIVVGTEGYFGTLPDGLQIYTEGIPGITIIGVGQPLSGIPESIENTSKDNLIFIVLNKSRNKLKARDLQRLSLIKTYPKPKRPDGTQEQLQVYQLTE